jgi:Family of unknown function (DUF5309)
MPIGLITYMDTTRPEDVTELITNVDFESTPFMSAIGEGTASNTLHEWQTDTYASSAVNAAIEGSDATTVDLTQPTRSTNVVQLFRKVIVVSDTEQAIPHYGMNDPLSYQTKKKLIELARDMEKAFVAGTKGSGSSGVARYMDGAIAQVSTNKTARTSGTSLDEDGFNGIIAKIFDGGTDSTADLVLTGSYLKRVIDKWNTRTTNNLNAQDYRQVLRVDLYTSSFGTHRIALSREVPSGAVLALDTAKWRKDYLVNRRPTATPLAKTGSSTKVLIEGEVTLAALNEKSSAYYSGYFVG